MRTLCRHADCQRIRASELARAGEMIGDFRYLDAALAIKWENREVGCSLTREADELAEFEAMRRAGYEVRVIDGIECIVVGHLRHAG